MRRLDPPRVATTEAYGLAEGPVWDARRQRLLWVDINAGRVLLGAMGEDGAIEVESSVDVGGTVGAVAPSPGGELIAAGRNRLLRLEGRDRMQVSAELFHEHGRRFNDGKPDPAGRFVVGTLGPGPQQLLRFEDDGSVTVLDDDLTLANGLAWTADGRRMYSIDSDTRRVFARSYDPVTGHVGIRETFLTLEAGTPDGMTLDEEDHLWIAVWGEGCVIRVSPDGEIVARLDLPAPHVTCPVFAGPDLTTLVITTAREKLDQHPLSGRLFTADVGVRGRPAPYWSGLAPAFSKGSP